MLYPLHVFEQVSIHARPDDENPCLLAEHRAAFDSLCHSPQSARERDAHDH